ncbi:MAG: MmcQ/YjbR family DNA-binding protein [Xanthomonadales bacterium]|nr:MmcQ/YjbR family DNA-binding protein [Xanthomonadales bacterium]
MARDLQDAVFELCEAFPGAERFTSHGSPNFRIQSGKVFAIFVVNHHHDGRVALWLPAPDGAQQRWVSDEPDHYFVPAYVGPRGWLGVHLDRGLAWSAVTERVAEAWQTVAPRRRLPELSELPTVAPPETGLSPDQVDPLQRADLQPIIAAVRARCLALPECTEALHYGGPSWYAGKRRFAGVDVHGGGQVLLSAKVGLEVQALMSVEPHILIPPYYGPQGWVAMALEGIDPAGDDYEDLLLMAYRQVANRRMLKALDGA